MHSLSEWVNLDTKLSKRVKGIEPSYQAWEACILPLNHTRAFSTYKFVTPNLAFVKSLNNLSVYSHNTN